MNDFIDITDYKLDSYHADPSNKPYYTYNSSDYRKDVHTFVVVR
ncbi:MAG: hypothetical protein ABIG89_04895 [Candidatus Woesearchaeota archaeon]